MARKKPNPEGRVDIALNKLLGLGALYVEKKHNLPGFAETMNPFIERGVKEIADSRTKLPEEVMLIGRVLLRRLGGE